jgi:hypothetical protein
MTSSCGSSTIVSERWSCIIIDCCVYRIPTIHNKTNNLCYPYTKAYLRDPCTMSSRISWGVDHQGSPQNVAGPSHVLPEPRSTRKSALDPARPRRLPRFKDEIRNSPRQHNNNITTMVDFRVEALAYPGVVSLVSFLAFSSQWLFVYIQPGPLRKGETYIFNILVAALLICYTRTCYTDPGSIPHDWHENITTKDECARLAAEVSSRQRYCRKCEMPKPPRAHHCKTCKR